MSIQWTPALESGVREIDEQHKQLFQCMNGFFDAWMGKKSNDEIKSQFDFLERYVITHFAWEEKYMLRFKYPSYDAHKAQHNDLALKFSALKSEFDEHGPAEELLDATSRFLINWLLSHIHGFDIKLGAFLKRETADAGSAFDQ